MTQAHIERQPAPIHLSTVILPFVAAFGSGFVVSLVLGGDWLADIQASLAGVEPQAYWYLARSSAFIAFGLLWLSMVLGLSITNRLARL